ncbi:hypothetical protein [Microbacterium sp.]|jgi:hypothetical protein|uniref:hypothetical protein n=1 Tax=Microbacterium sp. TaxID=51671 RepID=UPI0037C5CE19
MNIPKQFLNLIGAIVVLAVVTAGVLLLALPLYTQSSTTATDANLVAQTNAGYEAQIASLREREADMDEIEDTVAELRREIPAEPLLDDVFEVVAAAADTAGVSIQTVTVGETSAWAPRAALTPDAVLSTDGAPAAEAAPVTPDATTEGTPPAEGTDTMTTDPTTADSTTTDAATVADPQIQVAFTVTVTAPSPAQAERFIDALGEGNRLIGIVHSALTSGADSYDLTVNALAFARTEN